MRARRHALLWTTTVLVGGVWLTACADGGADAHLGVAGASCLRTADCAAPLQCLGNVCAGTAEGDADADVVGGDAALFDATADTQAGRDTDAPEILTSYDASDWETQRPDTYDPPTDAALGETIAYDDCGELGISDAWVGSFTGLIEYHLNPNPLVPEDGVLPVVGALSFDITCIESKFIVDGLMDGTATVEGQGDFPFVLALRGTYDPSRKHLAAQMVDGAVTIYEVIEVYFEGTFTGDLQPDETFDGAWEGESTGTNQALITGTAEGGGSWSAQAD